MPTRLLLFALLAALVTGCQETRTTTGVQTTFRQAEPDQADTDTPEGALEDVDKIRDPELKKQALVALVGIEPDNPKPLFQLGDIYEREGKYALAEHYYKKLSSVVPPDKYTGPYYRVGRALALQAKYSEAVEWLRRCTDVPQPVPDLYVMNPDYREAHYLLGAIANLEQNSERMVFHFKEFLRLGGERHRIARHLSLLTEAENP